MKNIFLAVVIAILPFVQFSHAQDQVEDKEYTFEIRSNKDSIVLAGAEIIVKGRSSFTATSYDGKAKLTLSEADSIVLIVLAGYNSEEINVNKFESRPIVFYAQLETSYTNQGFGLVKEASRNIGSSGILSDGTSREGNFNSFENTLQGNLAGVHVIQGSGALNSYSAVLARGIGTSILGTEPLYVVDGTPMTSGSEGDGGGGIGNNYGYNTSPLSEFNIQDIESIQYLKPGYNTALYGPRGANGVFLVTTKRGLPGRTKLNIQYQTGFSVPTNTVKMMDGPSYLSATDQAVRNSFYYNGNNANQAAPNRNLYLPFPLTDTVASITNNNWIDQVLQQGAFQQIQASATGGNKMVRFYFGGAYQQNKGILTNNTFNRLNTRFNTDIIINKYLSFGSSILVSFGSGYNQPSGIATFGGGFGEAQNSALPVSPVFYSGRNQNLNPFPGVNNYFNAYNGSNIALLTNNDNLQLERQSFRNMGSIYLDFGLPFVKNLHFKGIFGFDYYSNFDRTFISGQARLGTPTGLIGDTVPRPSSQASDNRTAYTNLSYSFISDYEINLGKNFVKPYIGISYQQVVNQYNGVSSEYFPSSYSKLVSFGSRFSDRPIGSESGFAFAGYFGGVQYDFDKRYLLDISLNSSASTRYGDNVGFVLFPSASLGWNIFKEPWLKLPAFVSDLKLSGGWSISGNSLLGNNQNKGFWRGNQPYIHPSTFPGRYPYSLAALNLKPELNRILEGEVQIGFLKNKLMASIGYFDRRTTNIAQNYPIAPSQGIASGLFLKNGGEISNRGIEINIQAQLIRSEKIDWFINLNSASLSNKVLSTNGLSVEDANGFGNQITIQNQQVGAFYLPQFAGFAKENDPNGQYFKGDELIFNRNGLAFKPKSKEEIEQASNTTGKSALPKFYGGLGSMLRYQQLTLDFQFNFSFGNYILDQGEFRTSYVRGENNLRANVDKDNLYYVGDGIQNPYSNLLSEHISTRFLNDASYVRLRSVGLSYLLTSEKISKHVRAIKIFIRAQNLLTFTNFKGWDPEALPNTINSASRAVGIGQTYFDLPQAKQFSIGINVQL